MGKGGKGRARTYSANDMRSMAKNPTSSHYRATRDNRANQLNPKHPEYGKGRSGATTTGASGILFAGEEMGAEFCGFCNGGPFENVEKAAHIGDVHLPLGRLGCEPHGVIFLARAEYEQHLAKEHAD